jgi:Protein of unknown function (DUF3465)
LGASLGALLLGLLAFLADRMGLLSGSSTPPVGGTNTGGVATETATGGGSSAGQSSAPAKAPSKPAAGSKTEAPTAAQTPSNTSGALFHGIQRSVYEQGLAKVENAFDKELNDVLIECAGVVVHILPDDTEGSQHQVFVVELENKITLKVAHNIDLAPRVPVERGDWIAFYGEYEWNQKGGVMHWTHHDPAGRHPDGWLLHDGEKYQ